MKDIKYCQNGEEEPLFIGLGNRHVYVMTTEDYIDSIELPLPGALIDVSDDCRKVVVTHYDYVTDIDLTQRSVTIHHSGVDDVSSLVYGPNDIAYMIPVDGSTNRMYCLNLTDGKMGQCSWGECFQLPANSFMYKHPNNRWLYTFTGGYPPQSLERFSIGGDSCIKWELSNPEEGQSFGAKGWFSHDASRLFTDIGKVLTTDTLHIVGSLYEETPKKYYWYEASPQPPHNIYVLEEFQQNIIVYR